MFTILRNRATISSGRLGAPSLRIPRGSALIHTSLSYRSSSPNHTTDSYSKDIDPSPPTDNTVHRVDPSTDHVQKPNRNINQTESTHDSNPPSSSSHENNHTTDTYSKESDSTPLSPDTTVHRVDSSSDLVQKPHEPPSGVWSRAGVQFEEYRHVEGASKNANEGRYGGRDIWVKEKGPETSKGDEGPEGKSNHGRKY